MSSAARNFREAWAKNLMVFLAFSLRISTGLDLPGRFLYRAHALRGTVAGSVCPAPVSSTRVQHPIVSLHGRGPAWGRRRGEIGRPTRGKPTKQMLSHD